MQLLDDPSDKVTALAAECFDYLEDDALGDVSSLVALFQRSTAFAANHEHLIGALEKTTARLPDVTIIVCERFLEIAGRDAGDMRTRAAGDAHRLSELIIRAYHQASDQAIGTRCLDTIDALLQVKAMGLEEALVEFDR